MIRRETNAQSPGRRSGRQQPVKTRRTIRRSSRRLQITQSTEPAAAPMPAADRPAVRRKTKAVAAKPESKTLATAKPVSKKTSAVKKPSVKTAAPASKVVAPVVEAAPAASNGASRWKLLTAGLGLACVVLAGVCVGQFMRQGHDASAAPLPAGAERDAEPAAARKAAPASTAAKGALKEVEPFAKFESLDLKRGGDWRGSLGKDGYAIFNDNGNGKHDIKRPDYIDGLKPEGSEHVWQQDDDKRGLEPSNGKGKRLSACVYHAETVTITLNARNDLPYRLSIYCLDYDKLSRQQRVEILRDDEVLAGCDMTNMNEGAWAHFRVAGDLTVRLTNTGPHNAVVSGVFFDEGATLPKRMPVKGAITKTVSQLKPGLKVDFYDGIRGYAKQADSPTLQTEVKHLMLGGNADAKGQSGWPFDNKFAAVFEGYLKIDEERLYTFHVESDDGSRLYIDGELVVDNDGNHGMEEIWGQVDLKPGLHRIWVEYYNAGGPKGLNVRWQPKDDFKEALPADRLFHD